MQNASEGNLNMPLRDKPTKGSAGGPVGSGGASAANMRGETHRILGGKRGASAAHGRGLMGNSNVTDLAGKIQSARRPPQHFIQNSLGLNDSNAQMIRFGKQDK